MRIFLAIAFSILSVSAASADPGQSPSGFEFCAEPIVPACIDHDQTYSDAAQRAACERTMSRFVNNALAYRACLQREIQRGVLSANAAIDRFKCRMDAKAACSGPRGDK
jgi:hypothetical protein